MANKHHYFFAVKLPKEVKTFLNKWVQMYESQYPFKKWVHPEDYHITLAFLGFAEEDLLNRAMEQVRALLEDEYSFDLTLNELGTFGPAKSPRIFWADVKESNDLKVVQKKVFETCLDVGFTLDKKPFKPHITLARKWEKEGPFERQMLTPLELGDGAGFSFTVSEIVLYETHLDQSPKYKEYARYSLLKNDSI